MQNNLPNQILVQRKIYGIMLEARDVAFLSIQTAFSLEEAYIAAKFEFEKQNPNKKGIHNPLNGSKIGLFTVKPLSELMGPNDMEVINHIAEEEAMKKIETPKEEEIIKAFEETADKKVEVKPTLEEEKNILMKQIIDNKDVKMFNKVKRFFSKTERAFIRDYLKS